MRTIKWAMRAIMTVLVFGPSLALAQDYPVKPIRAIVAFSPGGGTDTVARIVLKEVADRLGQPIIVENKHGAGGLLGWTEVARARADGYTIGIGANTLPLLTEMYDRVPFNPLKDFEFIAPLATVPNALIVNASLPVTNIKDLQAYSKKAGSALAYGTPGIGTPQHLTGALLARMAGIELKHVAYKGTANAVTDVIGNHIPLAIVGLPQALQYAKSGHIRIIGVASSKRSEIASGVATIAEGGLAGFESNYWWDIIGPKGMPAPVVQKLYDQVQSVLRSPSLAISLQKAGYEAMILSRDDYLQTLRLDTTKWTRIIRENQIKLHGTH